MLVGNNILVRIPNPLVFLFFHTHLPLNHIDSLSEFLLYLPLQLIFRQLHINMIIIRSASKILFVYNT